MTSRRLNNEDIVEILNQNDDDSEDGLDLDEDSITDPDYMVDIQEIDSFSENDDFDGEELFADIEGDNITPGPSLIPTIQSILVEAGQVRGKPTTSRKSIPLWKQRNLILNEQQLRFTGNNTLPDDIIGLDTPIQYFLYLFPVDIFDSVAEQTNMYVVQKDIGDPFRVTGVDIQQFIGVVYIMSLIKLPSVACHWSNKIGTPIIQEVMSLKQFEKIRQCIHFNDNEKCHARSDPRCDRLYKIRPIVYRLNQTFRKVPLEEFLSVDEQMCSTKARNFLKRYLPNKPHKWGYKIYVLCGTSGFAFNIEPETGMENFLQNGEPNLGASSNVVMRLARIIPRNQNYRLYFDNYFTSLPLLEYLANEGIHSIGTIRRNRIPGCKLPTEKEMSKKKRGQSIEFVTNIEGVEISTVSWKDNKVVNLASTFVGELPKTVVKRYDKTQKKYIEVERPQIVGEYNRHMGGVDLIDSIMGRYKIAIRSKRWQVRFFYHLLDLTMSNSWLLYKKVRKSKNMKDKELSSSEFRLDVATTLCKLGTKTYVNTRGSLEVDIQAKKRKGPAQYVPPKDVRQDQVGHWPIWVDKRIRCKFPNCKGVSQTMCEKCGVALCYNKNNNCFRLFHVS